MHVSLELSREVVLPFEDDFFLAIARETLRRCSLHAVAKKKEITLSAVAVSREKIQELNKTYRGKDAPTDILSFSEYADVEAFEAVEGGQIFLGDIFFCEEIISEAAKEDAVTEAHEMIYVFSHGILHLLGYDHSDEMFALQDRVTEALVLQSSNTQSR